MLTLKHKDSLSAQGWPNWEASSIGSEGDCHTPCASEAMVAAGIVAGRVVTGSGSKGCQMALCLRLGNSFCPLMWDGEVPVTPISSRMTVTRASACMCWWRQQPWWEQAGSCHDTLGAATGQRQQLPLQEEAGQTEGDACLPLGCNTDNHVQYIKNRFLGNVVMRKDFNLLQDASDKRCLC